MVKRFLGIRHVFDTTSCFLNIALDSLFSKHDLYMFSCEDRMETQI